MVCVPPCCRDACLVGGFFEDVLGPRGTPAEGGATEAVANEDGVLVSSLDGQPAEPGADANPGAEPAAEHEPPTVSLDHAR